MAQKEGMTDEQVEELVHALLDFRNMLSSLTDRFQNRLALLEQEFADYRSGEPTAPTTPVASLKNRPGTAPLEMPVDVPVASPEADLMDDEEAFLPEETETFSIVDIDDDDDF